MITNTAVLGRANRIILPVRWDRTWVALLALVHKME